MSADGNIWQIEKALDELQRQMKASIQVPPPALDHRPIGSSDDGLHFRRDIPRAAVMALDLPSTPLYLRPVQTGARTTPRRPPALVQAYVDLFTALGPVIDILARAVVDLWAVFLAVLAGPTRTLMGWWAAPSREAAARDAELVALLAAAPAWAHWAEENGMLTSAAVWRSIAEGSQ